jgi:hypothetical protein
MTSITTLNRTIEYQKKEFFDEFPQHYRCIDKKVNAAIISFAPFFEKKGYFVSVPTVEEGLALRSDQYFFEEFDSEMFSALENQGGTFRCFKEDGFVEKHSVLLLKRSRDQDVIGTLHFKSVRHLDTEEKKLVVEGIHIKKKERGKHLGSLLLMLGVMTARLRSCSKVELHSYNLDNARFYARFGFALPFIHSHEDQLKWDNISLIARAQLMFARNEGGFSLDLTNCERISSIFNENLTKAMR